jgi:hypothetical protein
MGSCKFWYLGFLLSRVGVEKWFWIGSDLFFSFLFSLCVWSGDYILYLDNIRLWKSLDLSLGFCFIQVSQPKLTNARIIKAPENNQFSYVEISWKLVYFGGFHKLEIWISIWLLNLYGQLRFWIILMGSC